MNISKVLVKISIIIMVLLISIPTTYKIIKNHNKNLIRVVESKILESAKKCKLEEKCPNNKIYLKDLYELNYLETVYNPITKEAYNENSYVIIKENKMNFKEVKS